MYWHLYIHTHIITHHISYIIQHHTTYIIQHHTLYIILIFICTDTYIYTPILSYIIYHISYTIHNTSSYIMHDISYQISYTHTHTRIYIYIYTILLVQSYCCLLSVFISGPARPTTPPLVTTFLWRNWMMTSSSCMLTLFSVILS